MCGLIIARILGSTYTYQCNVGMEKTWNSSENDLNVTLEVEGALNYYSLLVVLIFLFPATVINIFLFGSIVSEKTIPGTNRLILVNIVSAGQLTICALLMIFLASFFLSSNVILQPSELACRFMLFTLITGGAGRLLFMATLAVTVYVTVRKGKKGLKFWRAAVASAFVWLLATSLCLSVFSSEVVDITFLTLSTCSYHGAGPATFVGAFGYLILYGVVSCVVAIIFPILSLIYLKKNTLTEDRRYLRRIALFTMFLLVGNVFNSLGQFIPLLVGAFTPLGDRDISQQDRMLSLAEGVFIMISLIPTPILILFYFQKVRMRFFFLCVRLKRLCVRDYSEKKKLNHRAPQHKA